MDYRRLGDSGLKVSQVGLGCNNFGMRIEQEATTAVVDAAIEAGINFFDTADIYGGTRSEVMLGHALGARRHEIVLATKFAMPTGAGPDQRGGSRRYVIKACEASLKRLGTDYIDLYQMHMPDPETPIEETLRALDDLITSGKVRYIGNSNFTGWQIADADWTARTGHFNRFVSAQNNYSLVERGVEAEVNPACERFGLGMLPFFPLASGLLTGKYTRGEGAATGHAPGRLGSARRPGPQRPELRPTGQAVRLGRSQGPHHAGTGLRLAVGQPVGVVGDRWRDPARAGPGQRRRRRLEPDGG